MEILLGALAVVVLYTFSSLRILKQYERGVTFLLGKFWATKGPGLVFVPSIVAKMRRVSLRILAIDIKPQDVITRDNVSLKVNAVLYMRVRNPEMAVIEIEDYLYATGQLAQTTLRSVLGEAELDELLADRVKINRILKEIVDERSNPWGIEVSAVEVKDVDLPVEMKRAMARQAECERERRAKVIAAEGEYQAADRLAQAASIIGTETPALALRLLQTIVEISSETTSTVVLPIPMDLIKPFTELAQKVTKSAEKQLPESTGAQMPAPGAGERVASSKRSPPPPAAPST
ncbi:MAG: slipin family protein [Gemmatimonadota bacterium]|nr:MAG: slipin family protein [Gemmatimonadota bacterium]